MADEPKDYYDIIREKISDPEIQKALDAFHARGVAEQKQAQETAGQPAGEPRRPAAPPARDGFRPPASENVYPTEGFRRPAEGIRRPAGEPSRQQETGTRMPSSGVAVPKNGQTIAGPGTPQTHDPSLFRQYMQSANRPSVYSDTAVDDAYSAAYRDAMQKASGAHAAEARGRRVHFAVGLLVSVFAVFGLVCAVVFGVKGISSYHAKKEEARCAAYNMKLIPVAAVDPDAFDDVSAADMADLIRVAVWSMIGSGVDPNRYAYANGELCLPQAEVEAAYAVCFGSQRPIVHQTAEGYGYTVQYSADDAAYFIPMTTLEPIYTPKVVSVETKGGAVVVTCGLISAGMWKQDRATGDITPPDPDKYVRVTFRTAAGAEYISSLQSLGLPETALPSGTPSAGRDPQPQTTAPSEETTTEKQIVITWD